MLLTRGCKFLQGSCKAPVDTKQDIRQGKKKYERNQKRRVLNSTDRQSQEMCLHLTAANFPKVALLL